MIVRQAKKADVDAIITLLQASLGESLLKKSAKIWNFKHLDNPFGESTVLLAEENSDLIGVRAFMQWRWQIKNRVWTSYRAVDTATHPHHQGKGVFKKLTLQALDEIHEKGDCFVFNTPNNQSRPGYLKMGWSEVGKIKVALIPTLLYSFSLLFSKKTGDSAITVAQLERLCAIHNEQLAEKNVLFTPKSVSYLKWRYEENPLQNYFVVSTPDFYIAMYVKKHSFFNELRVVESIGGLTAKERRKMHCAIVKYALQKGCLFITIADKNLFGLQLYGGYGPKLTFRPLTSSTDFVQQALTIENWHYSLGDLELF